MPGPAAQWSLHEITVQGTLTDAKGNIMSEVLDQWARDPNAIVADLIGNPEFVDDIVYEPTYTYEEGGDEPTAEYVDDVPSAQWMWDLQVRTYQIDPPQTLTHLLASLAHWRDHRTRHLGFR